MSGRARTPKRSSLLLPADSAKLYATYRALTRGLQLVDVARRQRKGLRPLALAASATADAALWQAIRTESVSFGARLAIDLADAALWVGPLWSDVMTALMQLSPGDVEAGIVWGGWGFAFPVVSTVACSLARHLSGEAPEPLPHIPHAGAVIGGMAIGHGEHARLARARDLHAAESSAKAVRAFLAGQSDVAMGASSVIDQLKPVAILLEYDVAGSALNQVRSGWKDSLAEQSQHHAVFLASVVRMWQQLHNDHPDLAGYVDVVDLAEGDGTTLVTGHQARIIAALLEARDLRGPVRIEVVRRRATKSPRPGRSFDLLVGGEVVTVPADPTAPVDRFNPAPPAFLGGAWAAMMPARQSDGALPLPLALACSAAYLAGGLAFLGRAPEDAARGALWTGLAVGALQGAVCARCCPVRRRAGAHLFHGTFGLAPAGLLLAASGPHLSAQERRAAVGVMAAVAAISYAVAERPRSLVDLVAAVAHPAAAMMGMHVIASAAARETARIAGELRQDDEHAEAASFEEGRRQVLRLATDALAEAEEAFARTDLDPAVRQVVATRLEAIRVLASSIGGDVPSRA